MTRSTWAPIVCALALVAANVALATPTEEASLNTCQAQVKSAARTYVDAYVKAVGTCLQAISTQIIQNNADATNAARTCVTQFRLLNDSRNAGKSLAEKLTASIDKKCQPGNPNVTHTLADILGSGAGVPEPLEVDNIEDWCTNFGGSGSITTLQQWVDCVTASHACGAQQTIATQYPRAVEWLNDVKPDMNALSPSPVTDTSQISDAVAGLTAVVAAMDPANTGQAAFQCGDNGQLAVCTTNLATCTSNDNTCNSSLTTCNGTLTAVGTGNATAADVLSGMTFSSSAGLGVTGTMPNNSAMSFAPGASAQAIPPGYYNGSGTVAGDANLVGGNIVSGISIFGVAGTALPSQTSSPLKTGQTTPYGTGSDGDLQKGVARRYVDNGDGTITDTQTGLMWEKKDQSGGIHDWSNAYTWSGASYGITNVMDGTMITWFLAALNGGGGFAGYTDWRIPNVNELLSIVNYQNNEPAVDPVFNTACAASCTVTSCSCTMWYTWSSTTLQSNPSNAWFVYFGWGGADAYGKNQPSSVRAVRGGS